MKDDVSSCCSSSTTPGRRPLDLPPFSDRFEDIPEPIRSQLINKSLFLAERHLKLCADRAMRPRATELDMERLKIAIAAAEQVGINVEGSKRLLVLLGDGRLRRLLLMGKREVGPTGQRASTKRPREEAEEGAMGSRVRRRPRYFNYRPQEPVEEADESLALKFYF